MITFSLVQDRAILESNLSGASDFAGSDAKRITLFFISRPGKQKR